MVLVKGLRPARSASELSSSAPWAARTALKRGASSKDSTVVRYSLSVLGTFPKKSDKAFAERLRALRTAGSRGSCLHARIARTWRELRGSENFIFWPPNAWERMSGQITPVEIVGRRAVSTEGMIMQSKVLLGRPFAAAMFDPSATPPVEMESDAQVVAALISAPARSGSSAFRPADNRTTGSASWASSPRRREGSLPHGRGGCRRQLSLDRFAHALSATGRAAVGAGVLQVCRRPGRGEDRQTVRPLAGI